MEKKGACSGGGGTERDHLLKERRGKGQGKGKKEGKENERAKLIKYKCMASTPSSFPPSFPPFLLTWPSDGLAVATPSPC